MTAEPTSNDRQLVARLTAVSRNLDTISHHVGELLRGVSEQPRVGHRLVSPAGDLTTLGVETQPRGGNPASASSSPHSTLGAPKPGHPEPA